MADNHAVAGDTLPNLQQWLPLLGESLAQQGRFRWQLRGASMQPTLPPDCTIEIAPPPDFIELGALVVFASDAALVVHRLVHRAPPFLVTQGDNRREPDARLRPAQVLGIVIAAYDAESRIWPGRLEQVWQWRWIGRAGALWLLRRIRRLLHRPLRDRLP
jgi:hypothetical protein